MLGGRKFSMFEKRENKGMDKRERKLKNRVRFSLKN